MADFLKSLARKDVLAPLYDAYFAKARFPDVMTLNVDMNKVGDGSYPAYHPSKAGECMRVQFATRSGDIPPERFGATEQKRFFWGKVIHEVYQRILVNELSLADETEIEKEYDGIHTTDVGNELRVRGFADVARCAIPGFGEALIDYKSTAAYNGNISPFFQRLYEAQIQLYLELFDIDQGIILYIEKASHKHSEKVVHRDKSQFDHWMGRLMDIEDAIVEGSPPPCDCVSGPSNCPTKGIYA